jgi:hypothetical protein
MSDALNEFAINLPMTGVSAVAPLAGSVEAAPAPAPSFDVTASVTVPAEVDTSKHEHISVYVDSATVSNYNAKDPCVCVDVVLTVSIQNPITYANSSYKLVKRLSMDKVKLALQAEVLTPFQVVEAKTEEQVQAEKLAEAQADAAAKAARRAKELAGLI